MLQTLSLTAVPVSAQAKNTAPSTPAGQSAPAASPSPSDSNASQPPQIIVNPPAAPTPEWGWREQAAWAASIVLAVLGYVGIMLALRALKKIDRNAEVSAATAQAALDSANAALSLAQAIAHSERPWIVVTVEPFLTVENSFKIMASNRGRSPARLVAAVDQIRIVTAETELANEPEFEQVQTGDVSEPVVLLPGEATGIWALNRDDLPSICKTPEVLKQVERWQQTLFLYGRITYTELTANNDTDAHQTFWCCRYIHGEKSSALVMAGSPAYNKHT